MVKSEIYKICAFVVIFSLVTPFISSYSEESNTLKIEIKYTNGDRIDTYQTKYIVYQDNEKTPFLEKRLNLNPDTINLPIDHKYKVKVFVNGMFSEVGYVDFKSEPEKLDINIPLPGGLKFNVFFEDGEKPIDNAIVVIKSNDGEQQRIGTTNDDGDTMRYWLQSTTLQNDYYIAEIYYDEFLLTSVSNIKIHQGISQDQKIVVPIPAVVEELITFRLYDTESQKILKNDENFSVLLLDQNNTPIKESIMNSKGDIYFSSLPSAVYSVSVLREGVKDGLWKDTKIAITGNQNDFELFQQNPVEPSSDLFSEPTSDLVPEPVSDLDFNPVIYEPTVKNYYLSCNCVSFRLDGLQDYWLNNIQYDLINLFSKNNIPLTVGVIIDSFGNDPYLMDLVKNKINDKQLEIANHGLDSTPFTIFDEQKQNEMLQESTNKIYEKLNVTPTIFIPPENRFNEDTKKVLIENGYTYLSASMLNDSPPFPLKNESLYRFPAVATTGEYVPSQNRILGISSDRTFSDAFEGVEKYGFAVITIHPQEFSVFKGGEYTNVINSDHFNELETLIKKIKTQNIKIVPIGQINQKISIVISENQENPLTPYSIPSWIKNNAGWWRDGHIDDNSFVYGIQFLIKENILQIPPTIQGFGGSEIPEWIKDNAGWWADGKVSDDDFIYGVNYLVNQGIINIDI